MATKKSPKSDTPVSQAPAVVEVNGALVSAEEQAAWGASPFLSSRDTIIPKILLMQPMSKKVLADEAAFGELRDSVTNEVYGSDKKSIEIIPFHLQTVWVEHEKNVDPKTGKEDLKYLRTVPLSPQNDTLPLDEPNLKRVRTMQFYVLRPEELGSGIPKVIAFRITSIKAGKKLATQMYVTNRAAGLPPPGRVMRLSVSRQTNGKGTFAVMDVEPVRAATSEERASALKWFKIIQTDAAVKVDDSDVAEVETPVEDSGTTGQF